MTNEAVALIIAALWLLTGRGLNLCLVILCYYVAYLLSTDFPSGEFATTDSGGIYAYYIIQSALDSTVMAAVLFVSIKYQKSLIIYSAYSAIIATSLICEASMLLDQSFSVNAISFIHAARQEYSITLDLLFAAIGSKAGERLLAYVFLLTRGRSSYNRFYRD